jgi:hypothetical protein
MPLEKSFFATKAQRHEETPSSSSTSVQIAERF